MATAASPAIQGKLSRNPGKIDIAVFGLALVVGVIYTGASIAGDLARSGRRPYFRLCYWESRY